MGQDRPHNESPFLEPDAGDNSGTSRAGEAGLKPADYQRGADHPSHQDSRIESFKLPALSLSEPAISGAFDRADRNHDGTLDPTELDRRLRSNRLSEQERSILSEMRTGYDFMTNLSQTEVNQRDGISRSDLAELSRRRSEGGDFTDQLQANSEKSRLTESARQRLSPGDFREFEKDMQTFEKRMEGKPGEIAGTYREIERLFEAGRGSVVDRSHMGKLAMDVIHQAAEPRSVKQGIRETCTLASLESRIYTRHPSQAARLVADAATTGRYTTADGESLSLDRESISFYPDYWRGMVGPESSARSHASQIFQIAAANVFHDTAAGPGSETTKEYVLRQKEGGPVEEFLQDRATHAVLANGPGITIFDGKTLEDVNRRITGYDEPPFVIDSANARTPHEFRSQLDRLKGEDNYPAILMVDPSNPPFNNPGLSYHAVAIEPGSDRSKLFLNNQFEESRDQEVSADQLYRSMKNPASMADNPQAIDKLAGAFATAAEQLEKIDPKILRSLIHQLTPDTLTAIDRVYKQKTGNDLGDFLGKVLPEEDMRMLGYTPGLLWGWSRS